MHVETASRTLRLGTRDLELNGTDLVELDDATPDLGDAVALRRWLDEDGCLLLRGLQDRDLVLEARRQMVASLRAAGIADPAGGPLDCAPNPRRDPRGGGAWDHLACPAFKGVVESERIRGLMTALYGGEALTFDFKWMRTVGPGGFTGAHYDVIYMGRGSLGVLTVWTPFGDIGYEHGPLAVVPGSHRSAGYAKVRESYGRMDVDRDQLTGSFADDPLDVTGRFGGQWATTEFRAGDVLIFGMFIMHMSVANTSQSFRLSADTRWQKAGEPVDERWVGKLPKGHYAQPAMSVAQKRREWGI